MKILEKEILRQILRELDVSPKEFVDVLYF